MNFKDAYKSMNDNIHGDKALMNKILNGQVDKKKSTFLKLKPAYSVALAAVFAFCSLTLYRNAGFDDYSAVSDKFNSVMTNNADDFNNGNDGKLSDKTSDSNKNNNQVQSRDNDNFEHNYSITPPRKNKTVIGSNNNDSFSESFETTDSKSSNTGLTKPEPTDFKTDSIDSPKPETTDSKTDSIDSPKSETTDSGTDSIDLPKSKTTNPKSDNADLSKNPTPDIKPETSKNPSNETKTDDTDRSNPKSDKVDDKNTADTVNNNASSGSGSSSYTRNVNPNTNSDEPDVASVPTTFENKTRNEKNVSPKVDNSKPENSDVKSIASRIVSSSKLPDDMVLLNVKYSDDMCRINFVGTNAKSPKPSKIEVVISEDVLDTNGSYVVMYKDAYVSVDGTQVDENLIKEFVDSVSVS